MPSRLKMKHFGTFQRCVLSQWKELKEFKRFQSIQRRKGWESAVGLEIHAQISANSKLFSGGGTKFGTPVNSSVSLFDAALPGTLPILNRSCVEAAVLTALSLSCTVNSISFFDRKHYFYADLPTGYQITQQRKAIANNGHLEFVVYNPGVHKKPYYRKSMIRQLQLEQDSGKSLHVPTDNRSLIDLNRAGIALMEIVFEPDLKDGEEAGALVKELTLILQRIGTCNCRMEEGSLRVDANVSVNRKGEDLGTRTEVKNLSSIRSLVNAVEFEVHRQISLLETGERIVNETRSYDAFTKETYPMRDKEVLQDYRFMPEPNLPPLKVNYDSSSIEGSENSNSNDWVNIFQVKEGITELPEATRKKLVEIFGLRLETAIVIVNTPGFLNYFNSVMDGRDPRQGVRVSNVLSMEILEELNERNLTFTECPIPIPTFGEVMELLESETINLNKAKDLIKRLFDGDSRPPKQIVEEEGWVQVQDVDAIVKICQEVMTANPKLVADYKIKRKAKYMNQLIGKVKHKTGGKYDMKKVSETMETLFNSDS